MIYRKPWGECRGIISWPACHTRAISGPWPATRQSSTTMILDQSNTGFSSIRILCPIATNVVREEAAHGRSLQCGVSKHRGSGVADQVEETRDLAIAGVHRK